ncbi:MAG: bifunctional oligoribonuclease/PAP phosphatase NrnA [Candidatus Omnitrophica bacterium]|nr:bifunctional oligoribonuclease/PAP phosphatase NrnA [Candidatus Omnitrophota bacterium]
MSAKKIIKAIKGYSKFLITSHVNVEGDALGSELALASLLRKLGKTVRIVNADKPPVSYNFLPGANKVSCNLNKRSFQAAAVIDCATNQRIGKVARLIGPEKPIINIDHHIDNKRFGKINWIDPKASSVGEMIYRLFTLTKTKLDKKDALNIYTAILTDTGSFRHSNTTSKTLSICSKLLKFGINPAKVYSEIYESHTVQDVSLVTRLISKLSFAANKKIAWVVIAENDFRKIKGRHEVLDKILDLAKAIDVVKVVIIFSRINNRLVKLSLRSKGPIDVQKIAKLFGGGGHKLASGCVIEGSLKEAEQKVLRQVKKALNSVS